MSKATDSEGFPRLMFATDANGNRTAVLSDASGRLVAEVGYTFTNYATNQTTTVIKATAGFLHSVTVNTKGTVASAITLYDSTAAATNPIAVIDSLNTSGTFTYNCVLVNGLVITTTGTVAANVTVSWR